MITYDCINSYFSRYMELPHRNVFSPAGCTALVEWSERQPWWKSFAEQHNLEGNWRSTAIGDSNLFAINLYAFLNQARYRHDDSQRACASAT